MTIYDQLDRNKAEISRMSDSTALQMASKYQAVASALTVKYRALQKQIEEESKDGKTPSITKVLQMNRYKELVESAEKELSRYQEALKNPAEAAAKKGALLGAKHGNDLVDQSLGERPAEVGAGFGQLNNKALRQIAATHVGERTPVMDVMTEAFSETGAKTLQSAMEEGIARGLKPAQIVAGMKASLNKTMLARANTIARTEMFRAYREGNRGVYKANKDVIPQWVWHADISDRSCAACWAMHGQIFDVEEPMGTHPNCRCTMAPKTKTWAELGYDIDEVVPEKPTGPEAFSKLSEDKQRKILGPGKLKAYKDGDIELQDIVSKRNNDVWGTSRTVGSLESAKAKAAARREAARHRMTSENKKLEQDIHELGVAEIQKGFYDGSRQPTDEAYNEALKNVKGGLSTVEDVTGLRANMRVKKEKHSFVSDDVEILDDQPLLDDIQIYSSKYDDENPSLVNVAGNRISYQTGRKESEFVGKRKQLFRSPKPEEGFPEGTPSNVTITLEDTMVHEFGHSVANAARATTPDSYEKWKKGWEKSKKNKDYVISQYALHNEEEGFAEAFAAHVTKNRKLDIDQADALDEIFHGLGSTKVVRETDEQRAARMRSERSRKAAATAKANREKRAAEQASITEDQKTEQATTKAKELVAKAARSEPAATKKLLGLQEVNGGNLNGSFEQGGKTYHMLDARLKSEGSLTRKLKGEIDDGLTIDQAADKMNDVLRYTYVMPERGFSSGIRKTTDELIKDGYKPIRAKNFWGKEKGYAGVNTVWETPDGQRFELQFNTQHAINTKESVSHPLYEKQRVLKKEDPEFQKLEDEIGTAWKDTRTKHPPDVDEGLDHFFATRYKQSDYTVEESVARLDHVTKTRAESLVSKAAKSEPETTKKLLSLQDEIGGDLNGSFEQGGKTFHMLDARLKTSGSLQRKLKGEMEDGLSLDQASDKMNDILRYTYVMPENGFAEGLEKATKELKASGYKAIRAKNFWGKEKGYAGVNTVWENPEGQRFELQFNTKRAITVKESVSHPLYERQRVLKKGTKEYDDLENEIGTAWADLRKSHPPDLGKDTDVFFAGHFGQADYTPRQAASRLRVSRKKEAIANGSVRAAAKPAYPDPAESFSLSRHSKAGYTQAQQKRDIEESVSARTLQGKMEKEGKTEDAIRYKHLVQTYKYNSPEELNARRAYAIRYGMVKEVDYSSATPSGKHIAWKPTMTESEAQEWLASKGVASRFESYHGTRLTNEGSIRVNGFSTASRAAGKEYGNGVYTTANVYEAKGWAKLGAHASSGEWLESEDIAVIKTHVALHNPLILKLDDPIDADIIKGYRQRAHDANPDDWENQLTNDLRADGYDGIVTYSLDFNKGGSQIIAFDPQAVVVISE